MGRRRVDSIQKFEKSSFDLSRRSLATSKLPFRYSYRSRNQLHEIRQETDNKNIKSYHKQINKQVLARMWRKGNPSTLLVGMQTGAATVENNMEFPQKTKNRTAF